MSVRCSWCQRLASLLWFSWLDRMRNLPSIMLWGVVFSLAWFALSGLLITDYVIASRRAEENVNRFAELLANQKSIMDNEIVIIEDNKTRIRQNTEFLGLMRQSLANDAKNVVDRAELLQHVDHFVNPVYQIIQSIAKMQAQLDRQTKLWEEHVAPAR